MGQHVSRTDFEWVYTEEPHATRRKLILKKYPEIKKLYGYDQNFKWVVTGMVFAQIFMMFFLKDKPWFVIIIAAYCFGGVINHSLMLAIHDISHNLAFGHAHLLHNQIFGFFANLPIGLPISITFKKYHLEHHRYLGDEFKDPDVPTHLEAKLFCTTLGKFLCVLLQPIFYIFRPLVTNPKLPTMMELVNFVIQVAFDAVVLHFFGVKILGYLIFGSLFILGFHPVAGHFYSEHYMVKKGYETYSYYGSFINWITFNVGYHNEHHDFPAVPSSRLPEVKRIASEFYDNLPQHTSWISVLYDFIMDPDIGPHARIKRRAKSFST